MIYIYNLEIEIILTDWRKALCIMDVSVQMKLYFHYCLQSIIGICRI